MQRSVQTRAFEKLIALDSDVAGIARKRDGQLRTVEGYALDRTDLDLYGLHAAIDFKVRLRGTLRFDSIEALVEQMHLDVAQTRELCAE